MKYKVGDRIIIKESVLDFDKENKIPRIVTIEKIHDDIQCYSCKEINFVLNDNEIDKLDKISLVELSQMKNKPEKIKFDKTIFFYDKGSYFYGFTEIEEQIGFKNFNEPLIEIIEEVVKPNFSIGDFVSYNNQIWVVDNICECEQCLKRGFYEPTLINYDGDIEYIMSVDSLAEIEKLDITEFPKPILDKVEKEFLRTLLFDKNKVQGIVKVAMFDYFYIAIHYFDSRDTKLRIFKDKTMYKGMQDNILYTLKELDL